MVALPRRGMPGMDELPPWMTERYPNLERACKAMDEDAAGRPVTQRTVDTDEPIVVTTSYALGQLWDTAGKRVLTRLSFTPDPSKPRRVSVHADEPPWGSQGEHGDVGTS